MKKHQQYSRWLRSSSFIFVVVSLIIDCKYKLHQKTSIKILSNENIGSTVLKCIFLIAKTTATTKLTINSPMVEGEDYVCTSDTKRNSRK